MTSRELGTGLETGKRYRIRYRLDNQKVDREFVGTYLGWSRFYTQYDFDLRPVAGTSSLPPGVIKAATEVGKDVPHSQPVKVYTGREVQALENENTDKAFIAVGRIVVKINATSLDEAREKLHAGPGEWEDWDITANVRVVEGEPRSATELKEQFDELEEGDFRRIES